MLTFIAAIIAVYLLVKCVALVKNYIQARRTGFPVFVSPTPSENPAWMVLGPICIPPLKKYLPGWLYDRFDVTVHGWEFRQNGALHRRLGKSFVLVTPDECSLWSADPALSRVILQRRKDFIQPPIIKKFMGVFGSNVLQVSSDCEIKRTGYLWQSNGDDWQRQRRIIAPNLNERISATVWKESCRQAQSMLDYMLQNPGDKALSGLRCLAINVLGRAGYGQQQAWTPELQDVTEESVGAREAYFRTIAAVADMLLAAVLVPTWILKLPLWPASVRSLGKYIEEMPSNTKQVLNEERESAARSKSSNDNLLSMLVRFSDQEKQDNEQSGQSLSLTEDEISGNLFIFSTAGFDTTANTMGFAVVLLASYPEWQDWMREEMVDLDTNVSQWEYEDVFPKCPRTLAVMHETLRLFAPALHSTRSVAESQQLASADKVHPLPAPMKVFVSAQSIHHDPEIWGADASQFKPSRWIDSDGKLVTPAPGTFLPWSGGPRVCPGMKMSQVEFVATLLTLYHSARCEPLVADGENAEDKRTELEALTKDSVPKLTLSVRDPGLVKLRWVVDRV